MAGLGTDSVRWISCDSRQRLDVSALRAAVEEDIQRGDQPFLVVGTAGGVSTGAVDPLVELAGFCREQGLWFHIDGAYGGLAAGVPGAPEDLQGLALADSVAVDPHKWLYAPVEAGCILVKDPVRLLNAFSYRPPYYHFDTDAINYFDFGPQNSRGFRALKIWLAFQQAGRSGFGRPLRTTLRWPVMHSSCWARIPNSKRSRGISASARSVTSPPPSGCCPDRRRPRPVEPAEPEAVDDIEKSGAAFLSNAVVDGKYLLRMCIVNFRTSLEDIEALPGLIAGIGKRTFEMMQTGTAAEPSHS